MEIVTVKRKLSMRTLLILLFMLSPMAGVAQEDNLLVFKGQNAVFDDVMKGLREELDGEITINEVIINNDSKIDTFKQTLKQYQPSAVILLGNKAANRYAQLQKSTKGDQYPPSITMAALFAERIIPQLSNATAVRFEIPVVTSLLTMRQFFVEPIKKVGVVHRAWMSPTIEENRKFLNAEGVEIVSYTLPDKPKKPAKLLKKGVEKLIDSKVDVIWIISDNVLLNAETLDKVWLPVSAKSKLPVLVGIEALAESKLQFGNVAVTPDLYGLGAQGASIIFDLMDNDWVFDDTEIRQPIAVKKVVNQAILNERSIQYRKENFSIFDRVIEPDH